MNRLRFRLIEIFDRLNILLTYMNRLTVENKKISAVYYNHRV